MLTYVGLQAPWVPCLPTAGLRSYEPRSPLSQDAAYVLGFRTFVLSLLPPDLVLVIA